MDTSSLRKPRVRAKRRAVNKGPSFGEWARRVAGLVKFGERDLSTREGFGDQLSGRCRRAAGGTDQIRFANDVLQRIASAMSTVQEIKAAMGRLPLAERAALIAELCGWTDDEWDRRMKADARQANLRH